MVTEGCDWMLVIGCLRQSVVCRAERCYGISWHRRDTGNAWYLKQDFIAAFGGSSCAGALAWQTMRSTASTCMMRYRERTRRQAAL